MLDDLKKLGIVFMEPEMVEEYYSKLAGIFLQGLSSPLSGMILDLNALPSSPLDFKTAVIKWLIGVNLPRLKKGEEPLLTLTLILQCPVWRVIKPPLKKLSLTKEGLFGKPSVKTINRTSRAKGINR